MIRSQKISESSRMYQKASKIRDDIDNSYRNMIKLIFNTNIALNDNASGKSNNSNKTMPSGKLINAFNQIKNSKSYKQKSDTYKKIIFSNMFCTKNKDCKLSGLDVFRNAYDIWYQLENMMGILTKVNAKIIHPADAALASGKYWEYTQHIGQAFGVGGGNYVVLDDKFDFNGVMYFSYNDYTNHMSESASIFNNYDNLKDKNIISEIKEILDIAVTFEIITR